MFQIHQHSKGKLISLVVAAFIALLIFGCDKAEVTDQITELTAVRLRQPVIRRMEESISYIGTIHSQNEMIVSAQLQGTVREIPFREGDRISKGDHLVFIEASELIAKEERLIIERDYWQNKFDSDVRLVARNALAPDIAKNSERALLNAQAAINELHTQKAKTTAESPFSGIVLDWLVRPGQNVMPGQPLLMIGDDNTEVRADVVEDDLRRGIREGSSVRIALSANLFHYTKVSKVSPISNSRSRVFNVTMALPAEFNDLSGRGSSALVEFISKSHEEVVAVPSEAIADRHSDPHIFLVSANIARKEKISLGIEQDGWIEVDLNWNQEDWVVVSNVMNLYDGAEVYPVRIKEGR
jgi:RND family efflux transporter MFP subunit